MRCMSTRKPHAVCIPYPAQGHVTPMMMLAKLLHSHGFHITFVNTQYNHRRLLRSKALSSADVLPDFRFETIPDGLPPSDEDATQDIPSLCESIQNNALPPFLDLLRQLNEGSPPVSCVVSDGVMSFTVDAATELSIPEVMFWTPSACGFMGYLQYKHLLERGLTPLKDESDITNGYLDMAVEWIPGLKNMRLKDLPTFIRTTDPDDIMLNYCNREAQRASMAKAVIMNTFDELEQPVLEAMAAMLPPIYT
uniref:Glycosyltransferase N-terminal domain-containing protein n=2 Tax=Musa acuminata subsp. malaccensis TaxID=214687 RepID=A0A804K7R6_MUSAM